MYYDTQATATPEQVEAAKATIKLKNTVDRFITASKWTTGVIIILTAINIAVAIFDKI